MPVNPYEAAGRERKANAMVDAIFANGWESIVDQMTEEYWKVVAKAAGVKKPASEETIALVKQRLAARRKGPKV